MAELKLAREILHELISADFMRPVGMTIDEKKECADAAAALISERIEPLVKAAESHLVHITVNESCVACSRLRTELSKVRG